MRRLSAGLLVVGLVSVVGVSAHAPSGAIFTTVADGSEVNFNHYASKLDVYLDGGPGPGAPQTAAGLDDGTYVFQVTDPPGKTLLSRDPAKCRQFRVANGVIDYYIKVAGCPDPDPVNGNHHIGYDIDHGGPAGVADGLAETIQLMPFNDTPNNGGVYKVWVTMVADFVAGCKELYDTGKRNRGDQTAAKQGLEVVNCGFNAANAHGFIPSHSKTDNFKAKLGTSIREIDTRFFPDTNNNGHKDDNEPWIDGLFVNWTDPVGGTNKKTSYYKPEFNIYHEAHVEAIEDGVHKIELSNQPGCTVGTVHIDGVDSPEVGPQIVGVEISKLIKDKTWFVDVACVQ